MKITKYPTMAIPPSISWVSARKVDHDFDRDKEVRDSCYATTGSCSWVLNVENYFVSELRKRAQ